MHYPHSPFPHIGMNCEETAKLVNHGRINHIVLFIVSGKHFHFTNESNVENFSVIMKLYEEMWGIHRFYGKLL